jgi:hypothetical protein
MNSPLVNIVGFDGLDGCVTENVRHLYRRLGCRVVVGRVPVSADILVILRGSPAELDCSRYGSVHLYNYVGQDRAGARLVGAREVVLVEASLSLAELRPKFIDCGKIDTIRAWHPVYGRPWTSRPTRVRFNFVHVGNYKPVAAGTTPDAPNFALLSALKAGEGPVWGNGWNALLPLEICRGPVPLWKVPRIYRQSRAAYGVRYPFQRTHQLISSRFWMAPLNGCVVVSDEATLDRNLPGVYFDSLDRAGEFARSGDARRELMREAAVFWRDYTHSLEREFRFRIMQVPCGSTHLSASQGLKHAARDFMHDAWLKILRGLG